MLSFDSNILVYALNRACAEHNAARTFLQSLGAEDNVAICELVLLEVYVLLRNPAVFPTPSSPADAVSRIQRFRQHPRWRLVDYPGPAPGLMESLWRDAASPGVGRRRVFDLRLARTLLHHGVTELATANVRHFEGLGFRRVWNPLCD